MAGDGKPKMKNGVVKRGSTWSFVVQEVDPETGKRKPRWTGGFRTQREAKAARDDALHRQRVGQYVRPSKITVDEWLTRWIADLAVVRKPTTVHAYHQVRVLYLNPKLGTAELQQLRAPEISEALRELLVSGGRNGAPLSIVTIRQIFAVLRAGLNAAIKADLLTVNPCAKVTVPRHHPDAAADAEPDDGIPDAWEVDELLRFLEFVADDRLRGLWAVAPNTGLRRGELLGWKWDDIDLDGARTTIRRARVQIAGEPRLSSPKGGRTRSFALDAVTVRELRAHRARQIQEKLAWGEGYEDSGYVFTREDGTPLQPAGVSKRFARLVRDSDLRPIRFHALRHTYATLALQAGVSLRTVADRLGHTDPALTLRVYSHALPADDRQAATLFMDHVYGQAAQ